MGFVARNPNLPRCSLPFDFGVRRRPEASGTGQKYDLEIRFIVCSRSSGVSIDAGGTNRELENEYQS